VANQELADAVNAAAFFIFYVDHLMGSRFNNISHPEN
jgi:hypothetical protein